MLYSHLPETDKGLIINYVEDYNGAESGLCCSLDYLLRIWNTQKEALFHLLGDKLMIEKEISFTKSDFLIRRSFSERCRDPKDELGQAYNQLEHWINRADCNYTGVPEFNMPYMTNWRLAELLSDILQPQYTGNSFEVPSWKHPDKPIKIPFGGKPLKLLRKIVQDRDFPIDRFEQVCTLVSQVLNDKITEGTLVLSIHPLDYMTASDNDCDWESCMSWTDNGCYRQGTVEMMNSPMVLVAYLKSKTPYCISGGEWTNKRWRSFVIFEPNVQITPIKGYPYISDSLNTAIVEWIADLAREADLGNFTHQVKNIGYDYFTYDKDRGRCIAYVTDYMYNDFDNTETITMFDENYWNDDSYNHTTQRCYYSGHSECMSCGCSDPDFYNGADTLVGDCCGAVSYCDYCGEPIRDEDDIVYVDGETLCSDCVEERAGWDVFDEEYHFYQGRGKIIFYTLNGDFSRYGRHVFTMKSEEWLTDQMPALTPIPYREIRNYLVNQEYRCDNFYTLPLESLSDEQAIYIFGYNVKDFMN